LLSASSTKYDINWLAPQMPQTKKGNQHYSGKKVRIRVDTKSGLVHTLINKPANEYGINQAQNLLPGQENDVFTETGYCGIETCEEILG